MDRSKDQHKLRFKKYNNLKILKMLRDSTLINLKEVLKFYKKTN
jgi:hypothetical protein